VFEVTFEAYARFPYIYFTPSRNYGKESDCEESKTLKESQKDL